MIIKLHSRIGIPIDTKAASYDLSKPSKNAKIKFGEFKFEEDIMPKFVSKFSASVEFENSEEPQFDTYMDILSLYPHLDIGISPDEGLAKVNQFEAEEISHKLGKILYESEIKAKTEIGIWYLPKKDESPIIVEFDVEIEAAELSNDKGKILEEFPPSLINGIYDFYTRLQDEGIVDITSPKTKTDYVYGLK